MAQLYREAFIRDIQENLFAGVEFLNQVVSHDEYVVNSKVHLPQAGSVPGVQEDRSSLPANVKVREDTYKSYNLHELTTDPIIVKNLEKLQLSYNKRQSIMRDKQASLRDRVALRALYEWAGVDLVANGGQIILTTDDTNADAQANPPGATGNRYALHLDDISRAASVLDNADVPQEGRYLIIPSKVYWNHLVPNNKEILNKDYNPATDEDIRMGVVKKLYGFGIILRSNVVVYADGTTPTKKAVGAASATDDCYGIVGFQRDMVAKALGDIDVFQDNNNPTYYGDVLSALVMFGATQLREDGKGIVTIVQDTA